LRFSFLSESGEWRLASLSGTAPYLFNLSKDPSGEINVAARYPDQANELTSGFWREHWEKSRIAVSESAGNDDAQTLYEGFDVMRTPYHYGFAIGIGIGPMPSTLIETENAPYYVLAGQEDVWELQFKPGHGLEWHVGGSVLRSTSFDPTRCNPIILTGYYQPRGHLAKREPRSQIKLYSSGYLQDADTDARFSPVDDDKLKNPTFVNFGGHALFSNMMLSSFSDEYSLQMSTQFMDIYTPAFRQKKLSLADISMMEAELCH
jgi:hypothetical protein